jgi:glycosyltransferase involved in cell wall biosynthesis
MRRRTRGSLLSVVIPAFNVAPYLDECLGSVLSQTGPSLEVIVVDDGSTDETREVTDAVAVRDQRLRVFHTQRRGVSAARNLALQHATGDLLTFADADDIVPAGAYAAMARRLERTGADLVTGDVVRIEDGSVSPLPWVSRLHPADRTITIGDTPDLLGDIFAWNKMFRRGFWDDARLSWPEGVYYEDQPAMTLAFLRARRIAVMTGVVYHWRIRSDGSSITQQRARIDDLRDRWATKQMTLDAVRREGTPALVEVLLDRILPADLWRYFTLIPEADDAWWTLLVEGVRALWGERGLGDSVLPPVHRLTGWLVAHDRRADAETVIRHLRVLDGRRVARVRDQHGVRLDVPGIDPATVARDAIAVRPTEE